MDAMSAGAARDRRKERKSQSLSSSHHQPDLGAGGDLNSHILDKQ